MKIDFRDSDGYLLGTVYSDCVPRVGDLVSGMGQFDRPVTNVVWWAENGRLRADVTLAI